MQRRILVAEDSPTQAERLRLLLEGEGYRVEVARNGREGLLRLEAAAADLIISDVLMPEMDGFAFCQTVKSAERTRRIPFVLLTAQNTPADIIRGLELGADNFIPKPFADDALLQRVQRIFEHLEHRQHGNLEMEFTLRVGGRQLVINADKQQIIELLFATFGDLCQMNDALQEAQQRLEQYARDLEAQVTERRRAEEAARQARDEAERANRLKSEFLANMSHELRTPLNSIIGFAELMHDGKVGPVSPDHKEYLGDILTSSRHLLQLINDVLDLSKVESGKMEFRPEPVDLARVVGEVRDILRSLAGSRRIPVEVEIAPELGQVVADPARLKQLLYNYLSNALKFTPEGGQVTVRVAPEGTDTFRLEVQDTGVGIRPDDIGRLFVEFQQLDASAAKKYPGTGLGLALTKRIVEAQGGQVGVHSSPGQGSTFFAVLPRMARIVREPEPEVEALPAPSGAPQVLVIEDDRNDRRWLVRTLSGAGYAVETAATGVEGLTRAHARAFDAITLDLLLPDLNGREVLQAIRTEGPNRATPVIVVTVVGDRGLAAGFHVHDILVKPVQSKDLLGSLKRAEVDPHGPRPILVVDDDPQALKLAERTLGNLGYRAICRSDAEGGLQAADQEAPAAVVLDLLMPGMDGFEFVKRLRRNPAGRRTPVIVWTMKDLTAKERDRLRAAVQAVVLKSDGATALLHEVQSYVPARGGPATADRGGHGGR